MSLDIPQRASQLIASHVLEWGAKNCETGLFLLGAPDGQLVSATAWAGEKGIVRRRGRFSVSGLALARLFDWATDNNLAVHCLLHSHRGFAFLSDIDLDYGFSVPGFVSAIVPHYENPSADPSKWGWWEFDGRRWVSIRPPNSVQAEFVEVTFDENGLR